ncbi:two-component hybrid sensor and regulator [Richelia sinica FACHB-800]|uniref:histidine kinase n=1 Tax=Richelia sinica FACHB-800 TaxID=1357546 RepID=A0A975Y393_9NOST|nr:response regulator [Richelia sinica]MBD2663043.1 response regulator [Richelia sinica FACHB-800]QXE21899.1 two-component hybrid sensor and regulator [Richelia sinica FACHB-800]
MKAVQVNHNLKKNILVVDDTPDNLRLLSVILSSEGYNVRKALDGETAITACKTLLPDLILLDVMMPEMNGYEVCQHLKADEKTRHIPIIFISALNDVIEKVKAFDSGAVDYITKPFHKTEVLARIQTHLNLYFLQLELHQKNILLQQEIQERLQIESALNLQKQKLEQALADLQHTQTQLIQSEKMAVLGQIVAGIAHEINNPVTFISGNLYYAHQYILNLLNLVEAYQAEYTNPSPFIQEIINDIDLSFLKNDFPELMQAMERGANRIKEIVLSLRNFARLDEADMKAVDIHEGLDSTLFMLQHRLKSTDLRAEIAIIKNYSDLPLISCYPSQINQVFMHLLNNAIDALENCQNTPQITIQTELLPINQIKITITDNGCGIDESSQPHIFEPFFTTKPVGSGVGLGLAISYQIIVQQHQGQLSFQSSPGQGTQIYIEIPV